MEQLIKFKNKEYLLVESAIAKKEDYEDGLLSYAHLCGDGHIRRFGKIIGKKKDIKFLKKVEVSVKDDAWENLWDGFFQFLKGNNNE